MDAFDVQPLYRALVENAQDILGVLTAAGAIITISPAVRATLDLAPERLRGRHWIDQVHPDDRALCRRWLSSCADEGRHQQVQLRAGRPGRWRVLVLAGRLVHEDAHVSRIVFSARDATEEAAAAARLAEREARFRGAFHDAPIGKVLLDAQGRVLDANKAFASLMQRWVTELEGSDFLAMFAHSEGVEALVEAWRREPLDASAEIGVVLRLQDKARHLRVSIAPLAQGGGARAIAQVLDLTARIEAEEALQRNLSSLRDSHRQLQEMAWMASHDLKEPLRGVVGSLQLIVRRHAAVLGDSERQAAEQSIAQAKALRAKLDTLEARVGSMRDSLRPTVELAFADVVAQWQQAQAATLRPAGLELRSGELPRLRADPRLAQSLRALLDQALVWALEQGRPIQVDSRWLEGGWNLRVSTQPASGVVLETLTAPGGALFSLRSEIEECGAELQVTRVGPECELILRLQPD